jgi:hypothetical protein
MTFEFRPEDPGFRSDPFPLFRRLRDEDPAHWSPALKSWVLTRYDDVKAACLDVPGMSSDRLRPFFAALPGPEAQKVASLMRYLTLWMVFRDPPEHTRLRRLAGKVFNVKSIQPMRASIASLAAWLLDRIGERERVDFIADFAGPLPGLVIMEMLGVPREALVRVKQLSDETALFIGSARSSPEKYARAEAATREMADYFRGLIAERRAAPKDDLLTALAAVEDEGERLSEDELVATCILLLFAGHETTTHHLANGLRALLQFPAELRRLREDPGLASAAVEELLRYDGPIGALTRVVQVEHELHGKRLREGERVFLMMNAANRDPRAYPDPDRLDLRREGVAHLTFGFGPHICLGFPLARLEGQIALPAVLARWQRIELSPEPLDWVDSMVLRGLAAMPLSVAR